MTLARLLKCSVLLLLAAAGCSTTTDPPLESRRLELWRIDAPAVAPAGQPLTIGISYSMGYCDELTEVNASLSGHRLELELRGRPKRLPRGLACPDILAGGDTSYTLLSPPEGELTVVGLQPNSWPPIEKMVVVE